MLYNTQRGGKNNEKRFIKYEINNSIKKQNNILGVESNKEVHLEERYGLLLGIFVS
jgi:hypothetical protein